MYERWCHRIPLNIIKVKKFVINNGVQTGREPEVVRKRSKNGVKRTQVFENLNTLKLIELLESMGTFELSAILELMLSAIWNSQQITFQFRTIKQKCFRWLSFTEKSKLWCLRWPCENSSSNTLTNSQRVNSIVNGGPWTLVNSGRDGRPKCTVKIESEWWTVFSVIGDLSFSMTIPIYPFWPYPSNQVICSREIPDPFKRLGCIP